MCMRCDDGAEYECDRCSMQFCLDHVHQHTPDKCPASFGRVPPWMARRKAMPSAVVEAKLGAYCIVVSGLA